MPIGTNHEITADSIKRHYTIVTTLNRKRRNPDRVRNYICQSVRDIFLMKYIPHLGLVFNRRCPDSSDQALALPLASYLYKLVGTEML
ncbi:unnamed protein product [Tuber melanosporum]|uniref:(Perigord truffle) hypothetical protein n=1 Tax=Tuber melanosporum (strain Mel28) TaxID=656061 RepID=D5GCA5_TUBMM|nr:uncharacterized protein GSTUM_00000650001 [Tuber melanosporum]CAZ82148.1 unnamed protein product [Tuber melanosporum]